jgi:hypothetical protein
MRLFIDVYRTAEWVIDAQPNVPNKTPNEG